MKKYAIHDNGGRPFLVDVDGKNVTIHKQEFDWDEDAYGPAVKIWEKTVDHVFVGDKPKWQDSRNWRSTFVGNTILLRLQSGSYVFVGPTIFEFKPVKGDTIEEFFSEMGNSDVPYPHAVGKTHVYFFSDTVNHISTLPKWLINTEKDVYQQLWIDIAVRDCKYQPGMKGTELCKLVEKKDPTLTQYLRDLKAEKKSLKVKVIQKRI